MNKLKIIFPAFLLLATFSTSSQSWKPNPAALMTPWSEQINPQNVLPEYPRPTMERSEWQNLNGVWQFQKAKNGAQIIDNDLYSKMLVLKEGKILISSSVISQNMINSFDYNITSREI